jgi:integrase
VPPAPEVTAAIEGFCSKTVPAEAVAFAQRAVAAAGPPTAARARALLFATSRLGAFGLRVGLELRPEVLLRPSVVERLCQSAMAEDSSATRRTVRTNLRFVAARVQPRASAAPLSREKAKAPYSAAEIASYLHWADAQPTEARRRRLNALICLGAGAGLVGGDLRAVRGTDVEGACGGLVVVVHGTRSRRVPVRAEFHDRLGAAARAVGEGYLIGFAHPGRKNVTAPLVAKAAGGAELASLDTGRLRSTWLAACANDLGIKAFLDAAGVRCTQRLGDIVADVEPVDEARAVALLGGRR